MKTTLRLCICALVLTALSTPFTYADDTPAKADDTAKKPADKAPKAADAEKKVENPEYKNWAQFKPGAFSTLKMSTSTPMGSAEVTVTQTLKSITPEKAVIEVTMVQSMMGQTNKMPAQTKEVPAQVTQAEAQKALDPPGKIAEGEETLTICGKKVKAKWMEVKITQQSMQIISKVWTSEDMPGRIVKIDSHDEAGAGMASVGEVADFATKAKAPGAKKDGAKDAKTPNKKAEKPNKTGEKETAADKKQPEGAKKAKP